MNEQIRALYSSGLSRRAVAKTLGCSESNVRTACKDIVRSQHEATVAANKRNCKEKVQSYREIRIDGQKTSLHRLRAEQALGRLLRDTECVHHADGSKNDDAPLVICPNEAYHKLLHIRMRVVRAGGNPNTQRFCNSCGQVKFLHEFKSSKQTLTGVESTCRECRKKQPAYLRSLSK